MNVEEVLPDIDGAERRDACSVLSGLPPELSELGSQLGEMIDMNDDLDSGTVRGLVSFASPQSAQTTALDAARQMRDALLDHGVGRVRSPWSGKTGGVSIELMAGLGPAWYTDTYRARLHHHTASSPISAARMTPALFTVKHGRSDLQGPLANGYGGGDFVYRLITFSWANHPGVGGPANYGTGTIPKNNGRPYLWGTEWDWDGVHSWPDEYLEWMARCDAGIADFWRLPAEAQDEHKGWATPPGRKIDRNQITRSQAIDLTRRYWDQSEEEGHPLADLSDADVEKMTGAFLAALVKGAQDGGPLHRLAGPSATGKPSTSVKFDYNQSAWGEIAALLAKQNDLLARIAAAVELPPETPEGTGK